MNGSPGVSRKGVSIPFDLSGADFSHCFPTLAISEKPPDLYMGFVYNQERLNKSEPTRTRKIKWESKEMTKGAVEQKEINHIIIINPNNIMVIIYSTVLCSSNILIIL